MATVTINARATGQTLTLDSRQTDMCMEAIRDATRQSFWEWLLSLLGLLRPVNSAGPFYIAPDFTITVDDSGRTNTWEVQGRFVLNRPGSVEGFQFYFALLIAEWLDNALPGPTP
jgi:hypothetical protein